MNNLTPMKRFKENFKIFRANISHLYNDFTLNEGKKKYDPYGGESGWGGYSKGVLNDFQIIFYRKEDYGSRDQNYPSFSFVFDYIDKNEEEVKVYAQIKLKNTNKSIESSEPMSLEEFRLKINNINKVLKEKRMDRKNNYDADVVLNEFSQVFLNKTLDLKEELSIAEKEVKKALTPYLNKNNNLINDILELKENIKNTEHNVNIRLNKTKEAIRIKELEEELKILKEIKEKRKKDIEKKVGLPELKESLKEKEELQNKANISLQKKKESELNKYPNALRKRIKI